MAVEALLLVVDHDGDTLLARIGIMRALNAGQALERSRGASRSSAIESSEKSLASKTKTTLNLLQHAHDRFGMPAEIQKLIQLDQEAERK